ncbi:MAG: YkvA family protein [Chloroflexota bacterium]
MANRKDRQLTVPQGGMMRDFVLRLKLIGRLMGDKRVNFFLKLLPLASVAYLFWPVDVVPAIALPVIGVLDDAAILWIGSTLFVELCPPEVVREHMQNLRSNLDEANDVIDAESADTDE